MRDEESYLWRDHLTSLLWQVYISICAFSRAGLSARRNLVFEMYQATRRPYRRKQVFHEQVEQYGSTVLYAGMYTPRTSVQWHRLDSVLFRIPWEIHRLENPYLLASFEKLSWLFPNTCLPGSLQ